MPVKDIYHDAARRALEKDGWVITHDPFQMVYGRIQMFVDLGATNLVAADRNGKRIAVEIKSFMGLSQFTEFHRAIGQYIVYSLVMAEKEPERLLYLAVTNRTYNDLLSEPLGQMVIRKLAIRLLVIDPVEEVCRTWIDSTNTAKPLSGS